jgi:hypothetical protein
MDFRFRGNDAAEISRSPQFGFFHTLLRGNDGAAELFKRSRYDSAHKLGKVRNCVFPKSLRLPILLVDAQSGRKCVAS